MIVIVTCTLAFLIGVYKSLRTHTYVSRVPPVTTSTLPADRSVKNDNSDYEGIDVENKPIILRGDQKLVIENQHYLVGESIVLKDNATLVVRNSLFEHVSSLGKIIALNAYDNSRVILQNSILAVSCEETVSWNFHDSASLAAQDITTTAAGCFPFQKFMDSSRAHITSWDSVNVTTCDNTEITLQNSKKLLLDPCFGTGARVDEAFPQQTTAAYVFPNKNEFEISSVLSLSNSSVKMWHVRVVPASDITIRNTDNISLDIHAQRPWEQKTVSARGLMNGLFKDETLKFVDAKLHLLNTSVRAWNFFLEHTNKLYLENSAVHTITESEDTVAIVQDSIIDTIETKDFSEATFQKSRLLEAAYSFDKSKITFIDSTIGSDDGVSTLRATNKSVITLTHTVSSATMIEDLQGKIVVQ
ncbi:MAG: hypothetical protein G01um101448_32 [Parcubacteria group bacterium Gr01-1014_48]|nr:MAG: hypothetical protein Greene041614_394 [Parcubacteria group bacterium Greene0416_14]TSC74617.1 MAG: hypothetical protein G01um101448_32 [Parcubacteria group bacterium Gr01-1014_48]TSD01584.1 MAG: hypothetical protein Greene101415_164 [Parcubacteria group bacterium Greene1014_15]TSD08367.1 MAG: hypothetical protein Greene07144_162 [Parcubacteria group bacterium Greene0714_4]